jgi:hypothetical protein
MLVLLGVVTARQPQEVCIVHLQSVLGAKVSVFLAKVSVFLAKVSVFLVLHNKMVRMELKETIIIFRKFIDR